jgi:hypothetical protein
MTPRLAPSDEEAIAVAAERRASARRQFDAEALVAARVAELRAGRLDGRIELAGGRIIEWQWEGYRLDRSLGCFLYAPDGRTKERIGEVGKWYVEEGQRLRRRGWWAKRGSERRCEWPSPEEAMVWVEQRIG